LRLPASSSIQRSELFRTLLGWAAFRWHARRRGVFRSVLQQPHRLPALLRIALDANIACAALRRGRRTLGSGLPGRKEQNDGSSRGRESEMAWP
jgi:hypothetical protein